MHIFLIDPGGKLSRFEPEAEKSQPLTPSPFWTQNALLKCTSMEVEGRVLIIVAPWSHLFHIKLA